MHLVKHYANLFQMSYITRDMDAAIAHVRDQLGFEMSPVSEAPVEMLCYGEPAELVVKASVANIGRNQFEIIQPVSGPTHIYTDEVDLSGHILNFHHVAVGVTGGLDAYQAVLDDVRESGDAFAYLFPRVLEPDTKLAFCYIDTRERIGHFTEYLWVDESIRAMIPAAPPALD